MAPNKVVFPPLTRTSGFLPRRARFEAASSTATTAAISGRQRELNVRIITVCHTANTFPFFFHVQKGMRRPVAPVIKHTMSFVPPSLSLLSVSVPVYVSVCVSLAVSVSLCLCFLYLCLLSPSLSLSLSLSRCSLGICLRPPHQSQNHTINHSFQALLGSPIAATHVYPHRTRCIEHTPHLQRLRLRPGQS